MQVTVDNIDPIENNFLYLRAAVSQKSSKDVSKSVDTLFSFIVSNNFIFPFSDVCYFFL